MKDKSLPIQPLFYFIFDITKAATILEIGNNLLYVGLGFMDISVISSFLAWTSLSYLYSLPA
jgi:hypothetical protein